MLSGSAMHQWTTSATSEVSPAVRNRYEETLRTMDVEMRAELGRTLLPVTELMQLEIGDVIPLDSRVTDPIRVFVGSRLAVSASAGKSGKRRALKVNEMLTSSFLGDDDEN